MTIKNAFAVVYYVALSFTVFEDTFVEYPWISGEIENSDGTVPYEIYMAIEYQSDLCDMLLSFAEEKLGFTGKDVPKYPKLLKMLNTDKISLPILKNAAILLIDEMHLSKRDIDDVGKILQY